MSLSGYRILDRNYRCKTGEIDIIAQKDCMIVFVEVKTRRSYAYGTPAEAVNYKKRTKIIKTALWYLKATHNEERAFRFDILEVLLDKDAVKCNHIINAFGR